MQLKDIASLALAAVLSAAVLIGCRSPEAAPTSAQIESAAMKARQANDIGAERQVRDWAAQGMSVAQRELALLYQSRPNQRNEALQLFEHAARAGDTEAAFQLGEMLRLGVVGVPAAPGKAAPWYQQAARQHHAKAALVLGMLFHNGEGVPRDAAEGSRWLSVASELGNAHAMFLLSNAYREGSGVAQDPAKARALLQEAAEHDYPPALQELAMAMQTGDALSPRDEQRAAHLLKEASEHRHNNWNHY
jgi:TPR repeat protein